MLLFFLARAIVVCTLGWNIWGVKNVILTGGLHINLRFFKQGISGGMKHADACILMAGT
jgi:hypothetical protein